MIYARISHDKRGNELGVKRQVADCEALAASRGLTVAQTFIDNDLSAYSGVRRPRYEEMLEAVRSGAVTVVLAWHPDRLYRHPRDLETFVETVEEAGASVATVTAGELDLSTASGRMVARLLGATARYESEHKSERTRRKHRELAEAGKPSGGGDRPFGFEADRLTLRPDEAALIRTAADRLVAGDSVRSIHLDWRDRGIRTPRGGEWSKTSLARMLTSPRVAGLRAHRGVVVGEAVWSPIVTREQHEMLVALSQTRQRPGYARSYLLTGGLARCEKCGAAMVARPNARKGRRYACTADAGGCNGTYQLAAPLEDFARDAVFAALDGPALTKMRAAPIGVTNEDSDFSAELAALEARRREAVEAFGDGSMSLPGFQAIDGDVEARMDAVRSRMATQVQSASVQRLPDNAEALRGWWDTAELDERRLLVGTVLGAVEIGPATPGRNRFQPERVRLRWKV